MNFNRDSLLQSPLFAPLHPVIANINVEGFPTLEELNAQLSARQPVVQNGKALRFVEQGQGRLAFEAQYEPRCYLTGEVQTRAENWHDLLNALVWLTFPKAKAAINARHYRALMEAASPENSSRLLKNVMSEAETRKKGARKRNLHRVNEHLEPLFDAVSASVIVLQQPASQRGAARDTNTLLDESGVIVAYADDELAGLLRNFQWRELFWTRREQLKSRMGFFVFGHGLYEKAINPYIGMTGQGTLLAVEQEFFSWPVKQQSAHLDMLLADYLADPEHCSSTRELSPVPLLGVPGWAADNEHAAYYDNTDYFRAGRRAANTRLLERTDK